ncbi:endonuclease G, mitochondrial-like [Zootermopsis nevadensis]|uniref:endonuclease G, mitochondrial-like n=1 Tax=Zootermopsis nevadensis TaxID=136037 RepID=UPI000B8E4DD3|nr:endonuclease G, mitochondrial-like [Zootermopsis nevadensis]
MTVKLTLQVISLTGVGVGGWFSGILTERWKQRQTTCECQCINENTEDDLLCKIKRMPGLPIFGTVSAASPENKLSVLENDFVSRESSPVPRKPSRVSQIMKYGFPGIDTVRSFDDYVLSYDRRNRVPHWVFEHLTKETLVYNEFVDRSKCEFAEDTSVHPYFRSVNSDYRGTGFDRGHMAAAGNHRVCQKHVDQTFFLSNIAPQVGVGFNRHSWNRLEKYVRKMTKTYKNVYVCTGPLFLPRKDTDGKMYVRYQVIGANSVAVPTHFFKVVVAETDDYKLDMEAYVMPNQAIDDNTPLTVFQVPPESIERSAGLLFFDQLSKDKIRKINGRKSTMV